ncbi:hypothetical protein NHX12_020810 [Muraenolepis orangiensis]|uniref:Uncharacterized protein n=1 Tax=Muraenolepis orangiensis TaxID=630683 RepID=A0A9Q0ES61_9TELE|nr:hypothetical protein NHX12_020810 [Muraenolepis orangiensis]
MRIRLNEKPLGVVVERYGRGCTARRDEGSGKAAANQRSGSRGSSQWLEAPSRVVPCAPRGGALLGEY